MIDMFRNLPRFDATERCVKCGAAMPSVKFNARYELGAWLCHEHLHLWCNSCGFAWDRLPLDATIEQEPQPCTCVERDGMPVYAVDCPNLYHADKARWHAARPKEEPRYVTADGEDAESVAHEFEDVGAKAHLLSVDVEAQED